MLFLLPIIAGPLDIHAAEQTTAGMTKWEEKAVQAAKKDTLQLKSGSLKKYGTENEPMKQ